MLKWYVYCGKQSQPIRAWVSCRVRDTFGSQIYISIFPFSVFCFASSVSQINDANGLKFKQCIYNWWDHSLAIGEMLFLAWGIRVCYNVRNAESLYNEARMISYAIYNIAGVNILMIAFQWVWLIPLTTFRSGNFSVLPLRSLPRVHLRHVNLYLHK